MELFHITNINNLSQILADGEILSKSILNSRAQNHISIAYEGIQDRRSHTEIPCHPNGVLHDYVPFYFAPRSPMLYAINKNRVEGYTEGQSRIIYLVTTISNVVENRIDFVFSDGHPIMDFSQFYNDLRKLNNKIDWQIMKSRYWYDTPDDPDRKRRRQAEFLIYEKVPIAILTKIGVISSSISEKVDEIQTTYGSSIQSQINRGWYY